MKMLKVLLVISLCIVTKISYAIDYHDVIIESTSNTPSSEPLKSGGDLLAIKDTVLIFAEKMPEFEGGNQALYQFIGQNVSYPKLAQENNIQGRVIVKFIVAKNGEVKGEKIEKSIDPLLDNEALRVVRLLPKFKPATQNGKKVDCWYTLPMLFKLTD